MEGESITGRTNKRIKGWMGRADQTTKVRGMFVQPSQVNKILENLKIDNEGISTIGGFIYSQLGRIPSSGDIVETNDAFITVRSVVGRRIMRVSLTLK